MKRPMLSEKIKVDKRKKVFVEVVWEKQKAPMEVKNSQSKEQAKKNVPNPKMRKGKPLPNKDQANQIPTKAYSVSKTQVWAHHVWAKTCFEQSKVWSKAKPKQTTEQAKESVDA